MLNPFGTIDTKPALAGAIIRIPPFAQNNPSTSTRKSSWCKGTTPERLALWQTPHGRAVICHPMGSWYTQNGWAGKLSKPASPYKIASHKLKSKADMFARGSSTIWKIYGCASRKRRCRPPTTIPRAPCAIPSPGTSKLWDPRRKKKTAGWAHTLPTTHLPDTKASPHTPALSRPYPSSSKTNSPTLPGSATWVKYSRTYKARQKIPTKT